MYFCHWFNATIQMQKCKSNVIKPNCNVRDPKPNAVGNAHFQLRASEPSIRLGSQGRCPHSNPRVAVPILIPGSLSPASVLGQETVSFVNNVLKTSLNSNRHALLTGRFAGSVCTPSIWRGASTHAGRIQCQGQGGLAPARFTTC